MYSTNVFGLLDLKVLQLTFGIVVKFYNLFILYEKECKASKGST